MSEEITGKAKGGVEKAAKMTPEQRKALAMKMVESKKELAALPRATHGSSDHPLKIGDIEIPCFVLDNGKRVLLQSAMLTALNMRQGTAGRGEGDRIVKFLATKSIKQHADKYIGNVIISTIKFKLPTGAMAHGYEATVLADICDAVLEARKAGDLHYQQEHIAHQCEILMRGFARVGIVALVDEATGYQKDRAKDELVKILQAFVAKELQPYLKTFPSEYYEQLFRLYGYQFPPQNKRPQWRPVFFGRITNEVVYNRLAPAILPELKKAASKAEKKAKLHQWLTGDIGHPKLKEHLASIVSILKLSKSPEDFRRNVDIVHPRFGDTLPIDFDESNDPTAS